MCDEFVQRKRGRPFRKFSLSDAMSPDGKARANGKRCRDCPVYGIRWCAVTARTVEPGSPACRYGKAVMNAAAQAARRNRNGTEQAS